MVPEIEQKLIQTQINDEEMIEKNDAEQKVDGNTQQDEKNFKEIFSFNYFLQIKEEFNKLAD